MKFTLDINDNLQKKIDADAKIWFCQLYEALVMDLLLSSVETYLLVGGEKSHPITLHR